MHWEGRSGREELRRLRDTIRYLLSCLRAAGDYVVSGGGWPVPGGIFLVGSLGGHNWVIAGPLREGGGATAAPVGRLRRGGPPAHFDRGRFSGWYVDRHFFTI